ncbi:hypothetical protein ERX46_00490 [Brumimicrobium glaciale]|jgi:hypothetical protein|uniref:Uncharacterized protein n=1 Tax=Brumimicrobium glaciale TaxID=200475 RepID=A0A4Q4KPS8_9FLAO|nr:hypothetical protein [Brumimicrobium glaciale]RYM35500.1 hypothetical protein ERX46_00490 [Brumimicrobium glaciale]
MDNEKKLNILGLIIKIVIAVPALIFGFIVMTSGVNAESDELVKQSFMDSFAFSGVANISFYAIILAVILVLVFFVVLLVTRPVQAIKSILGIIVAAVLFFILYSIGTTDTVESLNVTGDITASAATLDFTHAGIYTAIIGIAVCSVLAMFMGLIVKLIRN